MPSCPHYFKSLGSEEPRPTTETEVMVNGSSWAFCRFTFSSLLVQPEWPGVGKRRCETWETSWRKPVSPSPCVRRLAGASFRCRFSLCSAASVLQGCPLGASSLGCTARTRMPPVHLSDGSEASLSTVGKGHEIPKCCADTKHQTTLKVQRFRIWEAVKMPPVFSFTSRRKHFRMSCIVHIHRW